MNHRYPRTERDLRWLATSFTNGSIVRGLPERLECLAAWHRLTVEAENVEAGEPNSFAVANEAFNRAAYRLKDAGVDQSTDEFAFSPHCGPDIASAAERRV